MTSTKVQALSVDNHLDETSLMEHPYSDDAVTVVLG